MYFWLRIDDLLLPDLDQYVFEPRYTFPRHYQICSILLHSGTFSVQIWINQFSSLDLDQAILGSQMAIRTMQEFDHFYVSSRILPARSGSGHSAHPRWLSEL